MTPALPMLMRRMVGRETDEGAALWFSRQRVSRPENEITMNRPYRLSVITNSIFSSRTYIFEASLDAPVWLIDCGDFDKVLEQIGERPVAGVLLTHAHFDHIYGLPELLHRFPQAKIVTNKVGLETLGNSRLNLSRYQGAAMDIVPENVMLVREGDTVPLSDGKPAGISADLPAVLSARVYETPGHHPSCLTFEVEDWLFTGDAYIPDEKVITNLPGGNKTLAAASLARLLALSCGKILCPGHSPRAATEDI